MQRAISNIRIRATPCLLARASFASPKAKMAFYYSTNIRGREKVKFPWIWPSDIDTMGSHSQINNVTVNYSYINFIKSMFLWAAEKNTELVSEFVFRPEYIDEVRAKMISIVLSRVTEAINQKDYGSMDDLMSPFLATMYKRALADMTAQGYSIKIALENFQNPELKTRMLKIGKPESYDNTIPFSLRFKKYIYNFFRTLQLSAERTSTKNSMVATLTSIPGLVSTDWMQMYYNFTIQADVSVSLEHNKNIIDKDHGTITIPITLLTPCYEGITRFRNAVSGNKDSEASKSLEEDNEVLEPFRWRVSDLFNISWNMEKKQIVDTFREARNNSR